MVEAVSRHWSVLRAAWSLDREQSRTRRRSLETEFLPAALEVIETPASPLGRTLLWALIALLGVALAWAFLGRLDVVAVAPGRIIPADRVKVIQPAELGVVRTIHVREGQEVRAGELLVELDPTMAGADEAQASRGLLAASIDRARARALLAWLRGGSPAFVAPPGTPPEVARVQRELIATQIEEHEARRAALVQQRAEHTAERLAATTERAKMAETLPLLDRQLEARRALAAKGFHSRLQLYEVEEERIERAKNVDVQSANAERASAAAAGIDQQLRQLRSEFQREAALMLAEAEDNISLRQEELTKMRRRQALQRLRAPVDGTVQQLSVHTLGGVVEPAQALMTIVPAGGGLVVEARLLNKDAGWVRVGQPVRVKVEAFPFTEHGVAEGVVEHVGRDAVEDEALGLVYPARIRLLETRLRRTGRLSAGMSVDAEVLLRKRSVIDYFVSPLRRTLDEAARET